MSDASTVLPPTPTTISRKRTPHTEHARQTQSLTTFNGVETSKNSLLDTPDESPASFPGSGSGSGRNRKRVEFSPWTNIHNPPAFTTSSAHQVVVRPIPPSRECSSSASILKISSQPDLKLAVNGKPVVQRTLADMLESVIQQLSRNDATDSIDAYQTLSSSLKAYGEVPDSQAMKSKLGSLLQHIRRDLMAIDKNDTGPADVNLVTQALKVLVVLAWKRDFSTLLSNDNQAFILDRAIHAVEEHKAPKGVILHYLHLLATQDFRQNIIISNNRVARLLDALKDLPNHVRGNGAVSERLMVYQRLIDQARSSMKAKPTFWIQELLEGLVSHIKDTRTKALELGTKVLSAFTSSSTISHALRTVLETTNDDGKTFGTTTCRRLEKMLSNKDDGLMVPQIWAIVLSLLKGIEGRIDKWNGLKDWLKVIQKCFNCSNATIRTQANMAWNRFVYVVRPSEATESLLSMLIKPIVAQMDRNAGDKEDRTTRATAFSAYCNLLYYAFRPAASHEQYDRVWNEYVVKVMTSSFFEKGSTNGDRSCRIFMALFWNDNTRSKLWREIRAQENVSMEPEELPTIDCKWVRARTASILGVFKLLFRSSSWSSSDSPGQTFVATAWRNFAKALGDASRKEMKPSTETMRALANVMKFLSEVWKAGPTALAASETVADVRFVPRFRFLCTTVMTEIGPIPFIEGRLSPELTGARVAEDSHAPFIQLLRIVSVADHAVTPDQMYYQLLTEILQLPERARTPTRSRLHLLRQCVECALRTPSLPPLEIADELIWRAIASVTAATLNDQLPDALVGVESEIDDLIDDVLVILQKGITHPMSSDAVWCNILVSLIAVAKPQNQRHVASISSFAETTMKSIDSKWPGVKVPELRGMKGFEKLTTKGIELILCVVPFIASSLVSGDARQGRGKSQGKSSTVMSSSLKSLLTLLELQLEQAYDSSCSEHDTAVRRAIDATYRCLRSCPRQLTFDYLKVLEPSLCLWLEDKQRRLTSLTSTGAIKLAAGQSLCSLLGEIMGNLALENGSLEQLSELYAAGFRSTHKVTVNLMIEMWNSTFGHQKNLFYPPSLKAALGRLRPYVDLELPSFEAVSDNETSIGLDAFMDSQEEQLRESLAFPISTDREHAKIAPMTIPRVANKATRDFRAATRSTSAEDRVTLARSAPRPKQRHDDSQVQYIAIDSSPVQDMVVGSQSLTDRQKEVRARQRAEPAVVFPDLRSSPTQKTTVSKPSVYNAPSNGLYHERDVGDNEPATPTLPSHPNGDMDDAMQSSPTPQSKQPTLRLDDIEMPSSPPSMPGGGEDEATGDFVLDLDTITESAVLVLDEKEADIQLEDQQAGTTTEDQANGFILLMDQTRTDVPMLDIDMDMNLEPMTDGVDEADLPEVTVLPSARRTTASSNISPMTQLTAKNQLMKGIEEHAVELSNEDMWDENTDKVSALGEAVDCTTHAPQLDEDSQFSRRLDVMEMSLPPHADISEIKPEHSVRELLLKKKAYNHSGTENRSEFEAQIAPAPNSRISSPTPIVPPTAGDDRPSDSDEVDMLSASQLSQDLDWHLELEARASQAKESPEPEVRQSPRKRKRSVAYSMVAKRRKSRTSPPQQDSQILEHASEEAREPKEMLDCIVVDTTSFLSRAVSTLSEGSQNIPGSRSSRKKLGRPRKQPSDALFYAIRQATPLEEARLYLRPEGNEVVEKEVKSPRAVGSPLAISIEQREAPSPPRSQGIIPDEDVDGTLEVGVTTTMEETTTTRDTAILPTTEPLALLEATMDQQKEESRGSCTPFPTRELLEGTIENSLEAVETTSKYANVCIETGSVIFEQEDVHMGILDSLRSVLRRLKGATLWKPALREVDDLLFEIRTEAQNAVGRGAVA